MFVRCNAFVAFVSLSLALGAVTSSPPRADAQGRVSRASAAGRGSTSASGATRRLPRPARVSPLSARGPVARNASRLPSALEHAAETRALRAQGRAFLAANNRTAALTSFRQSGERAMIASTRLMMQGSFDEARNLCLEAANGGFVDALGVLEQDGANGALIEAIRSERVEALFHAARHHGSHVANGGEALTPGVDSPSTGVFVDYRNAIAAAKEYGFVARSQAIATNGAEALTRIGRAAQTSAKPGRAGAAQLRAASVSFRGAAALHQLVSSQPLANRMTRLANRLEREATTREGQDAR